MLDTLKAQHSELVIQAVASIDLKSDEPGMAAFASRLDVPFATYGATELRNVEDHLSEKSDVVFAEVGCYGVAEAAALVHAANITGVDAELLVTKHKTRRATMAVARSYLQETQG